MESTEYETAWQAGTKKHPEHDEFVKQRDADVAGRDAEAAEFASAFAQEGQPNE